MTSLGRLRRLASRLGGVVSGGDPAIRGVQSLEDAGPADLAPLTHPRFRALARSSRAAAVLCTPALARSNLPEGAALWVHPEPWVVLCDLLARLPAPKRGRRRVHASAVVSRGAVLESGVRLGPRVTIGPNAVVCAGAVVGDDSVVGPGAVVGTGTILGRRVRVGAGAVVGSDGFGYAHSATGLVRIPHVGRVVVEDDVDIGANACIARATLGTTRIHRGTRIDNLVQIGHNVVVGEGTLLAAQVGVAGSTRVGKGVLAGGQAGVADHLVVGDGARLAAKAGVIGDVPPGVTVAGYPARPRQRWLREHAELARLAARRRKEEPR